MRGELCLSALLEASGNDLSCILRALGISRKTWNDWLWGISEPSKDQRDMLARWLNCSVCLIDAAVARNRESFMLHMEPLVIVSDKPDDKQPVSRTSIVEIVIQIIVSVLSSVVITLKILGRL